MSHSSILPTHTQQPSLFRLQNSAEHADKLRRKAIVASYAPDWALTLLIVGLFYVLEAVEPFKREFSLFDTSIQHTFAVHERVSDTNLILLAVVAPLVLMVVINLISIRSFWDCHTSWLGAVLGLAITGSITQLVKVTAGRLRPDFIDRCQPRPDSVTQAVFGLVNASICTQTNHSILKDGFKSFPSGHSSMSFAGLGFLFFYLAGKLHLFDQKGHTWKIWISVVPLMGASFVGISRTMDYRHHWHDVLAGSLLGLSLAWFSYRQYYPPLTHPLSHRPYSPRIGWNRTPSPGIRIQDGDDFYMTDEAEELHPSGDSRLARQSGNLGIHGELQGTSMDHADAPISLNEVWRRGEEEDLLPPGQSSSSLPIPLNECV